jgi:hypothetical protein
MHCMILVILCKREKERSALCDFVFSCFFSCFAIAAAVAVAIADDAAVLKDDSPFCM